MNTATTMRFSVAHRDSKDVTVTFDQASFERIAALFGYVSDECLESIKRAERDIRTGRIRQARKGARF
jgi:hypothetical protein